MTPQEKAKELYNKFFIITPQPYIETEIKEGHYAGLKFQDWDKNWTHNMSKKCAIISINELIYENESIFELVKLHGNERLALPIAERIKYLIEIKNEIEKL